MSRYEDRDGVYDTFLDTHISTYKVVDMLNHYVSLRSICDTWQDTEKNQQEEKVDMDGKVVLLGYKIGQTVYHPNKHYGNVHECKIVGISVSLYDESKYDYIVYTVERKMDKLRFGVTYREVYASEEQAWSVLEKENG